MKNGTDDDPEWCRIGEKVVGPTKADSFVQLAISLALGFTAILAFCILRPRWKGLYAARRRHTEAQRALPALPDSFLGWIPALYRITEAQVLASAGLDAYVFLSFFRMSMRLFGTMLFFAAVVLLPIHKHFNLDPNDEKPPANLGNTYLWAFLIFTWFFSLLTIYFMNTETSKVVKIRQDYLGTQSTITDRTFRLVGIPKDLRTEAKVKEFVENLEIGKVKAVSLCRDWAQLDALMSSRAAVLSKLEEAWVAYLAQAPAAGEPRPSQQHILDQDESLEALEPREESRLLGDDATTTGALIAERPRPKVRVHFGFLNMRSRTADALDYYQDKLRQHDENIMAARKKEYTPTGTAFVTMDSIAACQMAVQAVMDPRPGRLLSKPAPSPSDVVWKNTYTPWIRRWFWSWVITGFIGFLSIIWLVPVAGLAQTISICNIAKVAPDLADALQQHDITKALVRTGLPTLVVSLLNVLVPYLYDYLSNAQGMVSQGDVELSAISKNFFFVFFNIFVVYAVSGAGALVRFWDIIRDSLKDTTQIGNELAKSIPSLGTFYRNFIMLQGFGLFPFKLLQFGSIALYPIYRMGAKTPRDFSELVPANFFNYSFYLPTALLVFILCLVYSVLPGAYLMLLLGVCYFGLGYFTYKYQLLYSMEQPQHATGRAWPMICERIVLGLVAFQVVMISELVFRSAFYTASLILPLVILTFWYLAYYRRRYTPLTKFIALRSINRTTDPGRQSHPDHDAAAGGDEVEDEETRAARRTSTVDEDREKGMRFVNPSLVLPLEQPWIYQDPPPLMPVEEEEEAAVSDTESAADGGGGGGSGRYGYSDLADSSMARAPTPDRQSGGGSVSGASSFSFGDTHVWRNNGEHNV